jgi:hypothetical protein
MLQLPLVPAYALTVHKTQALSIKHLVLGCDALKLRRRTSCARHIEEEGERERERQREDRAGLGM